MECNYPDFLIKEIFSSLFWTFFQQYYKNESIHLNSWHHGHKKQKDGQEEQVVFADISTWTWNIWSGREYIKTVSFVRSCVVKLALKLF